MQLGEAAPRPLCTASPAELEDVSRLVRTNADSPRALGSRRDRAVTAADFAGAVARQSLGPFSLADLSPGAPRGASKRLRRLVDEEAVWDPALLRPGLVEATMAETRVLVVERAELAPNSATRADAFSISALGPGFAVPINWKVLEVTESESAPYLSELEQRAISELVKDYRADHDLLCPDEMCPLVVLDGGWFGEDRGVREALAGIDIEYLLEVAGDLDELEVASHGFATALPEQIASVTSVEVV